MPKKMIAPYISVKEYSCPCCGKLPPDLYRNGEFSYSYEYLFDAFKVIREIWGPIPITSGYRCAKHNAEVGGSSLSVHLFGLALDLKIPRDKAEVFARVVRGTNRGLRIGWREYTADLVHIDDGFYVFPRPTAAYEKGVEW